MGDEQIGIKKEPAWYGDPPDNGEPHREAVPNDKSNDVGHDELGGIDQLARSSYSAAINLVHGVKVKAEPQTPASSASRPPPDSVLMDVDFDRVIPQFVCAPDVDTPQEAGPPTTSCASPPQSCLVKQEPPNGVGADVGEQPQSDHGVPPPRETGGFVFYPVAGTPIAGRTEGSWIHARRTQPKYAHGEREAPTPGRGARKARLPRASSLARHRTRVMTVSCSVCSKKFATDSALASHRKLHAEKPFPCDLCHARFVNNFSLTKHRRIHTRDRPFACDMCEVAFASSFGLARHKATHTGRRPYVCEVCEARFARRDYLVAHKIEHADRKT